MGCTSISEAIGGGGAGQEACPKHAASPGKAGVSIPMQPHHTRGRPTIWQRVAQGGGVGRGWGYAASGEGEPGGRRGGVSPPLWAHDEGCLVWGTWSPETQPNTLWGGGASSSITPPNVIRICPNQLYRRFRAAIQPGDENRAFAPPNLTKENGPGARDAILGAKKTGTPCGSGCAEALSRTQNLM